MAVNPTGDRLPCSRHLDELWDHLARGTPDEHARACEHCQAALDEIRPLLTATSELAAEPARPPDDLPGRVMTVIRARIPPAPRIALPSPTGIRLHISEHAAAIILRAAGDTVEGVRARSCRLTPAGLKLTISLRFGTPAVTATKAVRAAVRAAARAQLGLTLGRIDIEVTDIHLA